MREIWILERRLAKRLRRHVLSAAKRKIEIDVATNEARDPAYVPDRDAIRAVISSEADVLSLMLAMDWLKELEQSFVFHRRHDPGFFLHPPHLDDAMLPVRSLSDHWKERRQTRGYDDEEVRSALRGMKAALAKDGLTFPPEAHRYFEILGCFVTSRPD